MRILIVEDQEDNLLMVSDMTQHLGYDPVCCRNGYEALDVLADEQIQLMIVDWMMPKMDGIELTHRVRAQFSERYIYILMLTAKDLREDVTIAFDAGADDFMTKPINPNELTARIGAGVRVITLENKLNESLEELHHLASYDHLTKLYNRRHFLGLARDYMISANDNNESFAVLMLDIDHFKAVNDRYLHTSGDMVLQAIAQILTDVVDTEGTVARYGGEEFVVVLYDCELGQAVAIAEQIRQQVEDTTVETRRGNIRATVSIGVAMHDYDAQDIEELLNIADTAMYKAKENGRNRVEVITHP